MSPKLILAGNDQGNFIVVDVSSTPQMNNQLIIKGH